LIRRKTVPPAPQEGPYLTMSGHARISWQPVLASEPGVYKIEGY